MTGDGALTKDVVTRWLDAHDVAWRAADRDAIADLFSEGATYHLGPFDESWRGLAGPFRGRAAIAAGWLAGGIEGEVFQIVSEILAIDGQRAVVRRRITYLEADGSVESLWDTCWVVDFDDTGRCIEYREWYVEGSAASG
jgi:putative lipase involved disintegration of autophagic bodies